MAQYGKASYWEERFTRDPEPFDWYQRWAGLKDVFQVYLKPTDQILNVGCGNSRLSEEMYDDGYHNITNIDVTQVVVQAMAEKYADKPGMIYRQMDMRNMQDFPEGFFNVVIDKATMDSILCGEGSTHMAQKCLTEISRVLNTNGIFLCVSHGQPNYRLAYLQRPEFGWKVTIEQVQKPMMGMTTQGDDKDGVHYIYICQKSAAAAADA